MSDTMKLEKLTQIQTMRTLADVLDCHPRLALRGIQRMLRWAERIGIPEVMFDAKVTTAWLEMAITLTSLEHSFESESDAACLYDVGTMESHIDAAKLEFGPRLWLWNVENYCAHNWCGFQSPDEDFYKEVIR